MGVFPLNTFDIGGNMKGRLDFTQGIHQDQRMVMNAAMEQAFHVLQLPIDELADYIEQEIQQNPVLDLPYSSAKEFDPSLIPSKLTLYDHLINEISFHFSTEEDKEIARFIAGSLDHNGLITLSSEEIIGKEDVLHRFQRMDPMGIGARSAQEALLIQIEGLGKPLLYKVVADHYHDLLHLRLHKIAKALSVPLCEVKRLIHQELRQLNPFPGRGFEEEMNSTLTADVQIIQEEGIWRIEVNDAFLPSIEIHPYYLSLLEEGKVSREETTLIRRHLASGKWLIRTLDRRKKILQEIAAYLLKTQREFLEGKAPNPNPLTMKEAASYLSVSESTITRAISNKALSTPRGLFPFRTFFNRTLPAKDLLQKLINQEEEPLSDEALSKKMEDEGVVCARRTVAKYRKELKIGSAVQRKLKL